MSKKNIYFYISVICFVLLSNRAGASDLPYKEGELLVRFAPKTKGIQRSIDERNKILSSFNAGTVKHSIKLVPGLSLVELPSNLTVADALPKLRGKNEILYVEPNYKVRLLSTFPDDTRFNELWGMNNTGQSGGTVDADIDAPQAWDIHTGSSDIIVAVIDTGVNYNHPDLSANMWVNEPELNGTTGVDDDDNGFFDDIYGYDFCNNDGDPNDDCWHGTHCAGTIGAIGNNGTGVAGVCWNVKIMALKFMDSYGYGWSYDAIACIDYAVQMGAKVLSNSWRYYEGNPYLTDVQALKDAAEAADANGVLFVAAAGNEGYDNDLYPAYPASYDCENIIAVMATDANDERSIWSYPYSSNWGATSVDLAAPGSDILSCVPYNIFGKYYEYSGGTSMATPHVAGACALIWSANPKLSHLQVKNIILNSVDKLDSLDGLCLTGGRLNLYNAVLEAANRPEILSKIDAVNDGDSVLPGEYITYTISYANPVTDPNDPNYIGTLTDAYIIDYLPEEVEPNNPFDPAYNYITHTCFWNIGTLSLGESNSVTLKVKVNNLAEPLGAITNLCVLRANEIGPITSVEITDVNSWNPGIIYVDKDAGAGSNTGMSWGNAYRDLQDALERARAGCGSEIWVAEGTYRPSERTDPNDSWSATFQLVDGVPIYGGFAGNETSRQQRKWLTNQTILTGDIDNDGDSNIKDVVTVTNVGQTTTIDGFTIIKGYWSGIYCDGGSPTISHNIIETNCDGIDCNNNSTPTISKCFVENNDQYGIFCENDSNAGISYCIVADNDDGGIYLNDSTGVIKNNCIHNNCADNDGNGIYIYNIYYPPPPTALIRNNSIVNNSGYGINSLWPEDANIINCILWGNNSGSDQLHSDNGTIENVRYSCIQNGDTNNGNINDDPLFYDDPNDPNNFHLSSNSPCIDEGDPNFAPEPDETDIDGEDRVVDGDSNGTQIVDIGADEYYWSPADFNGDEIVNFIDYARFANAWQSQPGDSNWDPNCNIGIPDNNHIDYNDLAVFCEDWLWQAGWDKPAGFMMMGRSAGETETAAFTASEISLQSISAEQQQIEKIEPLKIEQLIKWLEDVWLEEETQKLIDEDLWLKFVESLKKEM